MDNKKKTIVALWIGTTVVLALLCFLPQKADNFFLSLRVLNNEAKIAAGQEAENTNVLRFFRGEKDKTRVLKMLEQRIRDDRKWLFVYFGLILLALNTLACFLYIFNMKPVLIAAWIGGYFLIAAGLILRSYISVSP